MSQHPQSRHDMSIEQKLEWLMDFAQEMHKRSAAHHWMKRYYPWEESEADKFHIECLCGISRVATKEEYDAAEQQYDGY